MKPSFTESFIALLSAAALAVPVMAVTVETPECPTGDVDGNGLIDGGDLGQLLLSFGTCPTRTVCPSDLNGDGLVDGADLGELLLRFGPVPTLDYGPVFADNEAWQIGLEMLGPSGPLTLDPAIYDRIDRDLDLIREFEPALQSQTHTLAWAPDRIIISTIPSQPQDELECYHDFYQLQSIQPLFGTIALYIYAGKLNVEALAQAYSQLDAVSFAEPDGLIGGQNFYTPTDLGGGVWRWNIDDGFLDCFDGCDCHNLYTFETDLEGNVELISFQQVGQAHCDFGG